MSRRRKTDDERARDLILWARRENVALQQIAVGDVQLVLSDRKLPSGDRAAPRPAPGFYERFAGPLAGEISVDKPDDDSGPLIEDDDE